MNLIKFTERERDVIMTVNKLHKVGTVTFHKCMLRSRRCHISNESLCLNRPLKAASDSDNPREVQLRPPNFGDYSWNLGALSLLNIASRLILLTEIEVF